MTRAKEEPKKKKLEAHKWTDKSSQMVLDGRVRSSSSRRKIYKESQKTSSNIENNKRVNNDKYCAHDNIMVVK